ncbi:MAG TPA: 30S ribosomal protein S17 [Halieaceae bacterium]|jgi:small subunit ribosomal protein S17|uniref:30S ribosomal protein S17 n=1 Tax=Haliea TaxID=475794 RepID=UPI000415D731|nr:MULTISPECIES: 30S ribosomal protein S17 [Haliea]MCR9186733.1 30S ribosomal protein S17 [Halieaceae bacterium]MAY94489.1 30S ribosomal protein S17 [Haliea sp.]MBP69615.1 30S ribosomal protein S17 [Haliea sp.]HAN68298.1 30S ribosomal protein S17 [Halieaceae bacterium]HBQ39414.1 30S ribosomal protein S17 [Halieaceae bacterium]|tara:strand:+ start:7153 stop:7419 length:267 start_codon:yes stop_codon:yes gene_type:complete
MSGAEKRIRTATGKVVSNKMDKTITVLIERRVKHPVYGKYITRSSKIHAHDENNVCSIGDTVKVTESRPISKSKTWKLLEVVVNAQQV